MKVIIQIRLCTDGDFSLNNYEAYSMQFDGEDYIGRFEFDANTPLYAYEEHSYINFDSYWRAQQLFKHMLTDIHVGFSHYYVLDDLYHLFNDAIQAVRNKQTQYYNSISGNYEGTSIQIYVKD